VKNNKKLSASQNPRASKTDRSYLQPGLIYCFLEKELLYPGSKFRMSDEVLENYIRQLIKAHSSQQVTVAWQGGEPTLMGIDFYRRAIELQEKYKKPGMMFKIRCKPTAHSLTTNGAGFLRKTIFLSGSVSTARVNCTMPTGWIKGGGNL
jgi:hypothetical protein